MRTLAGVILTVVGATLASLMFVTMILGILVVIADPVRALAGGSPIRDPCAFTFGLALWAALSTALVRWGKQLRAIDVATLLRVDARPPILLLRSFADDNMWLRETEWVNHLLPWRLERKLTFEELLAEKLSPEGPVVAIARPGERLPQLGAARVSLGDDEWRGWIQELTDRSQLIVMMVGEVKSATEGVGWELSMLLGRERASALVFIDQVEGAAALLLEVDEQGTLAGHESSRWAGLPTARAYRPERR